MNHLLFHSRLQASVSRFDPRCKLSECPKALDQIGFCPLQKKAAGVTRAQCFHSFLVHFMVVVHFKCVICVTSRLYETPPPPLPHPCLLTFRQMEKKNQSIPNFIEALFCGKFRCAKWNEDFSPKCDLDADILQSAVVWVCVCARVSEFLYCV